jgi:hypothetical protein
VVAKLRDCFQNPLSGRARDRSWTVIDNVGDRRRWHAGAGSNVVARDPLLGNRRRTRMAGRLQGLQKAFWHAARIQTMKPRCQERPKSAWRRRQAKAAANSKPCIPNACDSIHADARGESLPGWCVAVLGRAGLKSKSIPLFLTLRRFTSYPKGSHHAHLLL